MISQVQIGICGTEVSYPLWSGYIASDALKATHPRVNTRVSREPALANKSSYMLGLHFRNHQHSTAKLSSERFESFIVNLFSFANDSKFEMAGEYISNARENKVINISSYIKTDVYQETKNKINDFLFIDSDDDFQAPNKKTIQDSLFFTENILKKHGIVAQLVRPVADGEINFFWEDERFVLDVALYGDDKYYYYFEDKASLVKYSAEKTLEQPLDSAALNMVKAKW